MATSNAVNANKKAKIKKDPTYPTTPNPSIVQANPAKILNKACPAIMFANNRTEIDITRNIYEINSIPISIGMIQGGHPGGQKNEKKWRPCV